MSLAIQVLKQKIIFDFELESKVGGNNMSVIEFVQLSNQFTKSNTNVLGALSGVDAHIEVVQYQKLCWRRGKE